MLVAPLEVRVSGHVVGRLERSRGGQTVWIPHAPWLHRGQRPPLGLTFLRDPKPQATGTGLPPWFENLLPERDSALRARLCAHLNLRTGDSDRLLTALGGDLPGAVEVTAITSEPAAGDRFSASCAERDAPPRSPSEGAVTGALRFSLTGMQLKLSMSARNARMALPAHGQAGDWIVKLPGHRHPELARVEAATMTWAKAAGFAVPSHEVIPFARLDGVPQGWLEGASEAYAIERFDRRPDGGRVHHEDLCQALAIQPEHKYGDSGPHRVSLDGALQLVVDACGPPQGRRFARRVGFVIASGNTDAHLKNWSLEWGTASRPTLSPCYDLVCTIAWPKYGWEREGGPRLALSLGRESRFERLSEHTLEEHARRAGYGWAAQEVAEGIRRAADAWSATRDEAPERMVRAVQTHWQRTPLLRGLLSE